MAGVNNDGRARTIAERLLDLEERVAQLEAQAGSPVRPATQSPLPADEATSRRPRKKGEESAEINQEDAAV